ncbi:hypothetical protein BIY24_09795 [Halobacteriovorax marinus]|uniref:trypsin-like serine peptidase n=1 Tax=Halobacteriovorax marinus TaxID=97084 RepID=UPI000BC2F864|nr:serine protease [Halobacteriovorax marinus]ATH08231.1 hypothetical protein BIY24_09795 [Halobacteriovorax marinus]
MKVVTKALCVLLMASNAMAISTPKVIYGKDDRKEIREHSSRAVHKLSQSVAGMVNFYDLAPSRYNGYSTYSSLSLGDRINACPGERFVNQPTLMSCTGFLVGEDTLVTAGHCVREVSDCTYNKWVFNFTVDDELIKDQDVYGCKEIIARDEVSLPIIGTTDYAIIKLDRKVKGRAPLKFRTKGKVKNGADVFVIGHPMGLPLKVADNATVKGSFGKTFKTNLDTYGGNSGSPVFNEKTGEVEGILVQGAQDFDTSGYCVGSNFGQGHNEIVYKITRLKALQELFEKGKL